MNAAKKYEEDGKHDNPEAWMQSMLFGGDVVDERNDRDKTIKKRILIMSSIVVLLFIGIAAKLFDLQVLQAAEYKDLAEGNRVRLIIDYAPRGKILDRNGRVIASNTLTFQLSATPFLLEGDNEQRISDAKAVARALDKPTQSVINKTEKEGLDFVFPLVVAENLSHEQALKLEAIMVDVAGYSVEEIPIRKYDAGYGLAHVVGYSGRVSEDDVEEYGEDLLPTDFIGKAGVEKSYDHILRGDNGWQQIEVDALGRPVRVLAQKLPQPGEDLTLSIDYDVQKAMALAMKEQMKKSNTVRAAGIAESPNNGEIFAMVSIPWYNNNHFAQGISQKQYTSYLNNKLEPLYNKVVAGGYPTGSTIKPLVASAALQEGVVTPSTVIVDGGAITLPGGFTFLGWRPGGLGAMNVRSAIAWSSNIYFYTVGGGFGGIEGLGEERLTKYYRMFGLGEESGIPYPGATAGRVPDEKWKLENKGEAWYQGDSFNISIGQGDLLVSPLQLSFAHSAIANNGYLITPQLIKGAEREVRRELAVDKSNLQIVREGMRQVLTNGTTCECTFSDVPHLVAGKSGTAETNTPGGRRSHAWYSAFAPYNNPQILSTVLIEEGSGGSLYAAPVINKAMAAFFASE